MKRSWKVFLLATALMAMVFGCSEQMSVAPDEYEVVTDTITVVDTLPGDTVTVEIITVDTVEVVCVDTVIVPGDTLYFPGDTITIVVTDTLEVTNPLFYSNRPWVIDTDNLSVSVILNNPAGNYRIMMDRKRLEIRPPCIVYFVDFGDGKEHELPSFGEVHDFIGFDAFLPANAKITISLKSPVAKPLAGAACYELLKGQWFLGFSPRL